MQLHSMVVDDFLSYFDKVREWADGATFAPVTSPVDGVEYPGICADIPDNLKAEVHFKLQLVLGGAVKINHIFARLTTEGTPVPHQAHNDATMGQCSFMLYLNRPEHCRGGTELVEHIARDMRYGPETPDDVEVWKAETNIRSVWEEYGGAQMKPNRAFIFDARLMHRAAPVGGFGKDAKDGRLVLTAFFDMPQT